MRKATSPVSLSPKSGNDTYSHLDLLNIADELDEVTHLFECAILAAGNPSVARYISNALQGVMLTAQARLERVSDAICAELEKNRELQQKKAA